MRFELYSLICQKCGARNAPDRATCAGCGGPVRQIRRCPGCQSENPPNAYVCVKCYRVLRSKPQTGFINFHIPWPVSLVVVCLCFGWFVLNAFRGWVNYVEAQVELRTQENMGLIYQKRQLQIRRAQTARKMAQAETKAEGI